LSTRRSAQAAKSGSRESPAKKTGVLRRNAAVRDRHLLYEQSVQCPEADVKFFDRVYRKLHGRVPHTLREDFCGTAALAAEWVRARKENVAYGVDLHRPTLEWGRRHNIAPLGAAAERVHLLEENVLDVTRPKVDMVAALNFSYFIFKQRSLLKRYFQTVRTSLRPGGVFVLDIFGGSECQSLDTETKQLQGFKYHWDQATYNPITNDTLYHIHFSFPDGTWMRRAFTYDWRMWTPREIMELLEEAGFEDPVLYWEGADDDGSGNGVFRPAVKREPEAGWIAYITATRPA
jgi:SAM-dependent methyltransferase